VENEESTPQSRERRPGRGRTLRHAVGPGVDGPVGDPGTGRVAHHGDPAPLGVDGVDRSHHGRHVVREPNPRAVGVPCLEARKREGVDTETALLERRAHGIPRRRVEPHARNENDVRCSPPDAAGADLTLPAPYRAPGQPVGFGPPYRRVAPSI
jgi:hypothetical protein